MEKIKNSTRCVILLYSIKMSYQICCCIWLNQHVGPWLCLDTVYCSVQGVNLCKKLLRLYSSSFVMLVNRKGREIVI